ncbi:MAG: DUF1329 domain-containing protein [Gammaproteobacteria bacterium]|nr:DUF1329 domain-containing protein [Gammaproteobacteria bacterium]
MRVPPHCIKQYVLSVLLALGCSVAVAGLSPEQVARLGDDLTPMGGEKAGNADGTIPAWEGGITSPPAGYEAGKHHVDPFPEDQIQFTITAQNVEQYADKLTAGHQALLATYPDSFKLHVYPTRRSAAAPQRIYDRTKEVAATAELVEGGNGVSGAVEGIPFPIPENGAQAIWNHILRWRAVSAARNIAQAAPTRGGNYTLVKFQDEFHFQYSREGVQEDELNNVIAFFIQKVAAPPRLAGSILLVHETLNQAKEHRKAWVYNPGQRRVRRAPNVAFDNPGTAADGMRTSDQFDMFNGSPERYTWELAGKREIYVPYNSYKLHSGDLKYADILTPLHVNPEHLRYELHRTWVVEATLREGSRHIYKRRTFYIDEDSWQVLVVDQYDNRDQLWRVSEGHVINYYDLPALWTTLEVHTDLQAGRYLAIGLDNEEASSYDFSIERSPKNYTTRALRKLGKR